MTLTERISACEQRQNELGLAFGKGEEKLNQIAAALGLVRNACDNYTECVLTPMLASLENRLMEQHNALCTIIRMLEAREARKLLKQFKKGRKKKPAGWGAKLR